MFFFVLAILLLSTDACLKLRVSSDRTSELNADFVQIASDEYMNSTMIQSGRAVYVTTPDFADGKFKFYLFHSSNELTGIGSWEINPGITDGTDAVAFIDSWSVTPYFTNEVVDNDVLKKSWKTFFGDEWSPDESMQVQCVDENEETIFFESDPEITHELSGFYVLRTSNSHNGPVYSKIKAFSRETQLYLYKFEDKWLIGESVGVDACIAYTVSDSVTPSAIESQNWNFLNPVENADFIFVQGRGNIITRHQDVNGEIVEAENVYAALRFARSIKYIPSGQQYVTLRNGIPMPTLGLGTGGLRGGYEMHDSILQAMRLGYRLFDMAREYDNEQVIPEILSETAADEDIPKRADLFIETKVWPTELGFLPTSTAIETSLRTLKSNYVDLYMLHWPSCNSEIEWMHCETTVDKDGTWQGSWQAFQKAYAEGRIMSLGVSNFDINLLDIFEDQPFILKPHVLQNWAEPGAIDYTVYDWCSEYGVPFQPYAAMRNLHQLSGPRRDQVTKSLKRIAEERGFSEYKVALRFMLQAGFAPIPRSSKLEHIRENLEVFKWELTEEEMKELSGSTQAEEL